MKVFKDQNNEITKEINTVKKQVGEYEMRLDTILTEYDIKDKSLINVNKYVEDLKLVIQKLELKIVRMREEDKEDSIGLTEQESSRKEVRDNEEEVDEDMTKRDNSSKTKGTQKHCKQTDEGGKFTKEIENSEEKENRNKHRAKIRYRFWEKCKYREQCEYRHSQYKESKEQ